MIRELSICVALSVITIFSQICAQTLPTAESILDSKSLELETAFESNDWADLKNILNQIRPQNIPVCELDSPYRFLYGHAALATGENSLAVEHFYCASDSNDSATLNQWYTWTRTLAERRPDLASTHYFYGDALARMGNLANAKEEFDKSLGIAPDHFLALNARGVVKWLIFEADSSKEEYELEAVDDFMQAVKTSPDFADAWANRGLTGLRGESALSASIEKFDRALSVDPKYWLALNGRAVAKGASGQYWDFQQDIKSIETSAPNTPFLKLNTGRMKIGEQRSEANRGAGLTMNIGLELKLPGPLSKFGNLSIDIGYSRGGIFMYLKEGQNMVVAKDGTPRQAGTWFALNYAPNVSMRVSSK